MMQIPCYSCPDSSLVDITEGCRIHEDTKASYLALVVAMKFSKWYYNHARGRMVKNTTLPFLKLKGDTAHYYPAPLKQIISYSLWECTKNLTEYLRTGTSLEFKDLVETLMGSDKALKDSMNRTSCTQVLNERLEGKIFQMHLMPDDALRDF